MKSLSVLPRYRLGELGRHQHKSATPTNPDRLTFTNELLSYSSVEFPPGVRHLCFGIVGWRVWTILTIDTQYLFLSILIIPYLSVMLNSFIASLSYFRRTLRGLGECFSSFSQANRSQSGLLGSNCSDPKHIMNLSKTTRTCSFRTLAN